MKRRAARSRHIASKLVAAAMAIAIVAAGGWYLAPLAHQWAPGANVTSRAVVTSDEVNLRSGPGTSFDVLTVVPPGTELSAERESVNGYAAVRVQGQHGWIATDYLSEPGVAYAAEHTVVQASSDDTVAISVPASGPLLARSEPTTAPVVAQQAPTAIPTAPPLVAGSTQVEREPQPGEKWIEVDRTDRTVTLHNGEIVVATFDALIGKDPSIDGYYSTAVGTHYVHVKEKALAETPFADGVYLSDFVGFDPVRSNGFHSPTRDEFGNVMVTGGTATLGCVRLSEADAVFLFDFAFIGMRVEVHD
jgi:uncharacterized protein YgiM (DUF1202 family)